MGGPTGRGARGVGDRERGAQPARGTQRARYAGLNPAVCAARGQVGRTGEEDEPKRRRMATAVAHRALSLPTWEQSARQFFAILAGQP